MSTSQTEGTSSEMVAAEQRLVMPVDIYTAAIRGDTEVLIQRLGLEEEPNPFETKYDNVRSELRSTTCSGDTILHLLITKDRNNEIAQKIFRKEVALLKMLNKKLETPLHIAARAGNYEVIKNLIQIDSGVVKDALREVDNNGDTALHVAAKYGHEFVLPELIKLDPQVAYQVNKEGLSSLYISILEGNTGTVKAMLSADPNLACTQFHDDTFPVHAAARMGNTDLVDHLIRNHTNSVELLDPQGRNLFHHAASENKYMIFIETFKIDGKMSSLKNVVVDVGNEIEMQEQAMENHILSSTPNESGWRGNGILVRMINEKDYQGNTPLHIASMKGARKTAKTIWKRWLANGNEAAETNNKGLTAFELSMHYELEYSKNEDIEGDIRTYVKYHGRAFSEHWFDMVELSLMKALDILQVIGLASVLMATVTFAAAFTIPGGYNASEGTPLLGRRYMFKTFIIANTLAFIQSFACIFSLVFNIVFEEKVADSINTPFLFLSASCCTVVAFGSGSYVMLAPINRNIAIIIFVLALLFGTPTMIMIDAALGRFFKWVIYRNSKYGRMLLFVLISVYALPLLFIFCLPFVT